MSKLTKFLMIVCIAFSITGCYHPDIQQGNDISADQLKQLKLGMTQQEVVNTLGTPVLQDVFNENRLVYVYTFLPNHGDFSERRVTLDFKNNKLVKINGPSTFNS